MNFRIEASMNYGHFNYLLSGQQPQQMKLAADQLDILAKTAAKRYIENQELLNDTITKMAREKDLNANQIDRVCEMANIETHKGLWSKTASKDSVSFPLADAKKVKAACGHATEKTAAPVSISDDYSMPPKIAAQGDLATLMGVDVDAVHNGLEGPSAKQRIKIAMARKTAERQQLHDRIIMLGLEFETIEKTAFAHVKQAVLGGRTFHEVLEAAAAAGLGKVAAEYLPQFQERLIAESHGDQRHRLVKMAIAKAPEDLISENLGNTTIVNGAHPLLVSLDTIQRKTGEIKQGLHNLISIDDELKVFGQKLREMQ